MRGYTNASGGSGSLEGITFDRESFIQYFESLGSINDVRDRMENFLSSVAYSFQSGTISADKIRTTGSNLMPRLDSFEDEIGRVIPSSPEESGLNNLVINFLQTHPLYPQPPHGDGVLQLTTEIGSGPFSIFLNPYRAEDSTWITVPKMNYWFSYYLYTSAPTNITGVIELVDALGSPVISVPFQITESNGWTRFSDDFELLSNNELSLKITIDQGGVTVYLDAIQLEHKTILNPSAPNDFSPGGKVIIEGGNIRAGSIFATDSIFADAAIVSANIDSLAANKIAAGRINTDIIQIGGEDNLMLMNDNKITFFQPFNGGEYAKVEIGKLIDAVLPEDQIWGLIVRNQDGSAALFDSNGITTDGINEGLRLAKIIDYNDIDDIYNIKGQYVSVDGSTLVSETVVASKLYAGDVEANKIQGTNIAGDVITAEHLNAVITTGKRIMLGESVVTAGIDGAGVAASTVRFWAGADYDNKATAPFRVTQDGSLYASTATISGSIQATSGNIGDFTITDTKLYSGFGGTYVGLSNNTNGYSIWVGKQSPGDSPFRVKTNGDMYAGGFLFGFNFTSGHNVILGQNIMLDDYDAGMIGFGVNVSTPAFYIKGGTNGLYTQGHFLPAKSNTYDIGNGTVRWRRVYSSIADDITSDIRLKENVSVVNHEYDQMILNTEIITYNLIGSDIEQIGINANAFHEKFGEAAKYITTLGEDGYYGATYTNFIPMLIKTIQALNKRIEALEEKWNS